MVPWEHWVCSQCWWENPYAVWLIKLRCFQPRHHQRYQRWTLVSIEPRAMKLVEMRPPPVNIEQHSSPIPLCPLLDNCQRKNLCQHPHSEAEYHTWEFIRKSFKGKKTSTREISSVMSLYVPINLFYVHSCLQVENSSRAWCLVPDLSHSPQLHKCVKDAMIVLMHSTTHTG